MKNTKMQNVYDKGYGGLMEIRLATLNDIEQICRLYSEFWQYNAIHQPEYCSEATESGEYPKGVITSDKTDIFVADAGGELVGLVNVRESETLPYDAIVRHRYAEIIELHVKADFRRQGIGSKLIDAAKQWSKARNLDYIELMSLVNADEANSFYDNEDFAKVSYIRRYTLRAKIGDCL